MANRILILTKEQREYRDTIVKPKRNHRKNSKKYVEPVPTMTHEEKWHYYFNNCMWWLNEFKEGRCSDIRAMETIKALTEHIRNKPSITPIRSPNK